MRTSEAGDESGNHSVMPTYAIGREQRSEQELPRNPKAMPQLQFTHTAPQEALPISFLPAIVFVFLHFLDI